MPHEIEFVAQLVYDEGEGHYGLDEHIFRAPHPEIAYPKAVALGREERYDRRFLGLAELMVATGSETPYGSSCPGDAADHVRDKHALAAFSDPRWRGVPCTEEEIEAALRPPPPVVEIEGLAAIDWASLSHAYGTATDVPRDLARVASSDRERALSAVWELAGSIHHQGTLYSATAEAIPFLVELAAHPAVLVRPDVLYLLAAVAESSATNPKAVREAWAWRREAVGEVFDAPSDVMAEREIAASAAAGNALRAHLPELQALVDDPDAEVADAAAEVLLHLRGT